MLLLLLLHPTWARATTKLLLLLLLLLLFLFNENHSFIDKLECFVCLIHIANYIEFTISFSLLSFERIIKSESCTTPLLHLSDDTTLLTQDTTNHDLRNVHRYYYLGLESSTWRERSRRGHGSSLK